MSKETPARVKVTSSKRRLGRMVKTTWKGGIVTAVVSEKVCPSANEVVEAVSKGLPVAELDDLSEAMGVADMGLGTMLGISQTTLVRRRAMGTLKPSESDRVVRFAHLMRRAIAVFGSRESALDWLRSPQFGLGGKIPLRYAETEVGAREVADLLGRIDYGVYS
jgi:putative toxin-antitoxin system antitoxin component (TIGR02293 family)